MLKIISILIKICYDDLEVERMIVLEKKTFEISHIQSIDELNQMSITLNDIEQVSHIKISQETIVFCCIDIEPLISLIQGTNKNFVVKEVMDSGQKRQYDYTNKEKKHYFMFKNIVVENDVYVLIQNIENHSRYQNIEYDAQNKILMLTSSSRDVLSYLRKELFKINPSMEIVEHRKPIRSQDVFNEKYLYTYIRIALTVVFLSLALISSKDQTQMTTIWWLCVMITLCEKLMKKCWDHIKQFHFLKEEILVMCALIMGIISQAYIETCIAAVVYQLITPLLNEVLKRTLEKIDEAVERPEQGIKVLDGVEKTISLYDFELKDILKIPAGQTIPMPGNIVQGQSQINTYMNTSTYDLLDVNVGDKVHSGDVNVKEDIYISITKTYESSNFAKLLNIASTAPVYESKMEKYSHILARFYTPLMMIFGFFLSVVLPIIDFKNYGKFIHVGAILLIASGSLSSHQSTSLGVLAGFAKAFQEGILIESTLGLDSVNATETIVYDRFDGQEVTEEELELFKRLSHMGKILVIFNDGPVALEDDQYTIYNYLSVEEKLEKMDSLIGPIVYIGDSFKDIQLLQKSFVGISRGGLADSKVVENSDIVLADASLSKVYETFSIARQIRTTAIFSNIFTIIMKIIVIVMAFSIPAFTMWMAIFIEIFVHAFVIRFSAHILE